MVSTLKNKFILEIGDREKEDYLNKISGCLDFLASENFLGIGDEIKKISTFIDFYKYDSNWGMRKDIVIDTRSGFPNLLEYTALADVRDNASAKMLDIILETDKDYKAEGKSVGELINYGREILLKKTKEKIYSFNGLNPQEYLKKEQEVFREIEYLSKASSIDMPATLQEEAKKTCTVVMDYEGYKSYELQLSGFDSTKGLFSKYVANLFVRDRNKFVKENRINKEFSIKLDNLFGNAPDMVIKHLSKNNFLVPASAKRLVIGPFYNKFTLNEECISNIINDGSFIFRIYEESARNCINIVKFPADENIFARFFKPRKARNEHIDSSPRKDYLLCSPDIFKDVCKNFSAPQYEIMEFGKPSLKKKEDSEKREVAEETKQESSRLSKKERQRILEKEMCDFEPYISKREKRWSKPHYKNYEEDEDDEDKKDGEDW